MYGIWKPKLNKIINFQKPNMAKPKLNTSKETLQTCTRPIKRLIQQGQFGDRDCFGFSQCYIATTCLFLIMNFVQFLKFNFPRRV